MCVRRGYSHTGLSNGELSDAMHNDHKGTRKLLSRFLRNRRHLTLGHRHVGCIIHSVDRLSVVLLADRTDEQNRRAMRRRFGEDAASSRSGTGADRNIPRAGNGSFSLERPAAGSAQTTREFA